MYGRPSSPIPPRPARDDPGDGGAGAPHPFGPEVEVLLAASLDARVAPEMESALDRIIQEVLHNICKHAEARRVSVRIEPGENEIRIDRRAGSNLGGRACRYPSRSNPFPSSVRTPHQSERVLRAGWIFNLRSGAGRASRSSCRSRGPGLNRDGEPIELAPALGELTCSGEGGSQLESQLRCCPQSGHGLSLASLRADRAQLVRSSSASALRVINRASALAARRSASTRTSTKGLKT